MARVLSVAALVACVLISLVGVMCGAAFANAEEAPQRTKICRHISAVDPFPNGKNDFSILYPHISEVTMRTHFYSHQVAGYVGKLNLFLKNYGKMSCPTDETSLLLHFVREFDVTNNLRKSAHQAYNHALYFAMLRKNRTLIEVQPSGDDSSGYVRVDGLKDDTDADDDSQNEIVTVHGQTFRDSTNRFAIAAQPKLLSAVKKSFKTVQNFTTLFTEKALNHFASGWVWLVVDPATGLLSIADTHDDLTFNSGHTPASLKATIRDKKAERAADNTPPNDDAVLATLITGAENAETVIDGRIPLAVCDVWEHAYYLDFQSKRKDYVEAWFKAVDWSRVEKRLAATDFELSKSVASPENDYTYSMF